MSSLFRPEALEHSRRRLDGDVMLTKSISIWILTALISLIAVGLVIWVVIGKYSRVEPVQGEVVSAGITVKVFAERAGQIVWLGVREGDVVQKGQPIARVVSEQELENGRMPSNDRLTSLDEETSATLNQEESESRRFRAERAKLVSLLEDIRQEQEFVREQIELQLAAVSSTKAILDGQAALLARGFTSKVIYEERRQAWLASSSELAGSRKLQTELEEKNVEAHSDLAKLPLDHEDRVASLRSNVAAINQKRIDARNAEGYTISASETGTVTAVQASVGKDVDGRLPLMSIVPQASLIKVVLFAPSRAIGLVRPGQTVRLRYDAFPYQRFGSFEGRIDAVSHNILSADEVDAPFKISEPVYQIQVTPKLQSIVIADQKFSIRPGMTLGADLILDQRSFLAWLMDPILALRARA